jgi:hypothetical protein
MSLSTISMVPTKIESINQSSKLNSPPIHWSGVQPGRFDLDFLAQLVAGVLLVVSYVV